MLAVFTVATSFSFSHGLTMKSSAPNRIASTAVDMSAKAVIKITFVTGEIARIFFNQNIPWLPVVSPCRKFISSSTTSTSSRSRTAGIRSGVLTVWTVLKVGSNSNLIDNRTNSSSSTTSMVPGALVMRQINGASYLTGLNKKQYSAHKWTVRFLTVGSGLQG